MAGEWPAGEWRPLLDQSRPFDPRVAHGVRLWTTSSTLRRSQMATVRLALVADDERSLYIRVINPTGRLSQFNEPPLWAIAVYSGDFSGSPNQLSSARGFYGGRLRRPMTYLVARWSNSNELSAFTVRRSKPDTWAFSHHVTRVAAPQWDPSRGRVDLIVPIEEFARGNVDSRVGAYLEIGFEFQDPRTGAWYDHDFLDVPYRLSPATTTPGGPRPC